MAPKPVYEIDGNRFSTLEGFYDEISRVLIPGPYWGRNLDAFNDILRGGFGTPEVGFILRWKNSQLITLANHKAFSVVGQISSHLFHPTVVGIGSNRT